MAGRLYQVRITNEEPLMYFEYTFNTRLTVCPLRRKCGTRIDSDNTGYPNQASYQPDIENCIIWCDQNVSNPHFVNYRRSTFYCQCQRFDLSGYTADPDFDSATNNYFIN